MRRILWVSLFVVTSVAAVHAQPKVGNWVAGNSWAGSSASPASLVYIDPTQTAPAVLSTIRIAGVEGRVNSCSMHPNNRDFLVGFTNLSQVALVDLNGAIVSLATIPSPGKGHVKGEDGSVFVVSGADIYKADITNKTSAKFNTSALPPLVADVALDHRSGDIITGGLNSIIALDATTGAVKKTITTAVPSPFRIVHDPVSDDFFVSEGARSAWNRVTRAGVVTWTKINIGAGGLKAVAQRGTILTGASNRLAMMDASGSVAGGQDHQYPRTNNWRFDSVEIYGSASLSGSGSLKRGSTFALNVSFPQAAGGAYRIGASLGGHQPGIRFPSGDILSLVPDALFWQVAVVGSIPGLFNNFAGVLDAFGNPKAAQPTIQIPAWVPAGVRVYLQAIAFHKSLPGGLAISNTWAISVR